MPFYLAYLKINKPLLLSEHVFSQYYLVWEVSHNCDLKGSIYIFNTDFCLTTDSYLPETPQMGVVGER